VSSQKARPSPPSDVDRHPPLPCEVGLNDPQEPTSATDWNADELRVTFSGIPHRRWLYSMYLLRGEVTVMPAPGGSGKTASVVGMAVEIATAGERLGEKVFGQNLTVIYLSGEESSEELRRRFWAFCLLHDIPEPEIARMLKAGTDDKRVQAMVFLPGRRERQNGFQCRRICEPRSRAATAASGPDCN
jgi:hypothetical protein